MLEEEITAVLQNAKDENELIKFKELYGTQPHVWLHILKKYSKKKTIVDKASTLFVILFLSGIIYIPLAFKFNVFIPFSIALCILNLFFFFLIIFYASIKVKKALSLRIKELNKEKIDKENKMRIQYQERHNKRRACNLYIKSKD